MNELIFFKIFNVLWNIGRLMLLFFFSVFVIIGFDLVGMLLFEVGIVL